MKELFSGYVDLHLPSCYYLSMFSNCVQLNAGLFLLMLLLGVLPCAWCGDYYAARNGQTPSFPYTTWESAALHIQDAVNAATTNDTVWVGAGRYTAPPNFTNFGGSNVVFINRPLTLRSSNGVPASTVIDGQGSCRGIAVRYVTTTSNQVVIDGFTISNCFATNIGGGIFFQSFETVWTGVVRNCIISDNTVAWGTNNGVFLYRTTGSSGGGLGVYLNSCGWGITITNCIFRRNRALPRGEAFAESSDGGGLSIRNGYGNVIVDHCLIESNYAVTAGGFNMGYGMYQFLDCVFRYNEAYTNGSGAVSYAPGGGALEGGRFTMRNCLVYNNYAYRCGGIYITTSSNSIYNSTIVSNRGSEAGGVWMRFVHHGNNAHLRIWNSIIYSNTIPNINVDNPTNQVEERLALQITNSCFTTNGLNYAYRFDLLAPGKGNTTNSPMFVNFAGEDFRLRPDSPCFNTGTNQEWMRGAVDLDGRKRLMYGTVDMGAYERLQDATVYRFR